MGCPAKYLQSSFEPFVREKVLSYFVELERAGLRDEMQRLCALRVKNNDPYANYDFGIDNRAINVRSVRHNRLRIMLEKVASEVRARMRGWLNLHGAIEPLVSAGEKAMWKLNDRGFDRYETFTLGFRASLLGRTQTWPKPSDECLG